MVNVTTFDIKQFTLNSGPQKSSYLKRSLSIFVKDGKISNLIIKLNLKNCKKN